MALMMGAEGSYKYTAVVAPHSAACTCPCINAVASHSACACLCVMAERSALPSLVHALLPLQESLAAHALDTNKCVHT